MQNFIEFNLKVEGTFLDRGYTIAQSIVAEGRYLVQSRCPSDVGYVKLVLEPYEGQTHFLLEWSVTESQIPRKFLPGVMEGIQQAAREGIGDCSPVIQLRIQVIDGFYHAVDSRARSYQVVTWRAIRSALEEAGVVAIHSSVGVSVKPEETITQSEIPPAPPIPHPESKSDLPVPVAEILLKREARKDCISYLETKVGYGNAIVFTEATFYPTTSYSRGREVEDSLIINQENKQKLLSALERSLNITPITDPETPEALNSLILQNIKCLYDRGHLRSLDSIKLWLADFQIPYSVSDWIDN